MKKKECPACAMEVDENTNVCPICGYEFTSTGGGRKWIAILLLALIVIALLYRLL
ncbi:MAG: zinc ribbon domain-containing protein [Cyclobacteriaceae bacterium]